MSDCPCGSGAVLGRCCGRYLPGRVHAPSPEALMRSRYTAYALGDARYLMRTTDPEGPHHRADRGAWADELRSYCQAVDFVGLEIVEAGSEGDAGFVHFRATLEQGGRQTVQEERSRFRRRKRRWLYTDAEG